MKEWQAQALDLLRNSLSPLPHEKNELDWKLDLSDKTERLKEHLSAFSNIPGGGYLVFGVNHEGRALGIGSAYDETIKRLGNIARDSLEPGIILDHAVVNFDGAALLFIRVPECSEKPVHLRGKTIYDAFTRSAGQTRKLEKREIARLISESAGTGFEDEFASNWGTADEALSQLDTQAYFELSKRPLPQTTKAIAEALAADKILKQEGDSIRITNLGAILFAKDLRTFDRLKRKTIRVIVYEGTDRSKTLREQEGQRGYAAGFSGLIRWINDQLPTNEVIGQALRQEVKMYPELAVRELVANAIIHQDFNEMGTGPMVEIFSNRVEITNPGKPLVTTLRLIDYPAKSRNEALASLMRNLGICEERGSGIDKVIFQVEFFQLPPPSFTEYENHFKAILYAHQPLTKMSKDDRVRACYQHCCLKFVSGQRMSNQTLRNRFTIKDDNYPMASRIISDSVDAKLIKLADTKSRSRKYATYVPFWA